MDSTEIRRRAWETRRELYGPRGHSGPYQRPCLHCVRMRHLIVELCSAGVVTEEKAALSTGLDRAEVRRRADELPVRVSRETSSGEAG